MQKAGFIVTVVAFDRNSFISRLPNCEIIILGKIENGKYLRRLLMMFKSFWKLRRLIKKSDLVYALSPDLAIFSYFSSIGNKKPLVIDVADIRKIQVAKSLAGYLFRKIDKFVSNRCNLIVVTSAAFITEYYIKSLKVNTKDYFLLENKVDYQLQNISYNSNKSDKIRIGYFGVLRDNWTVNLLINLLDKFSTNFEVLLAGINMIEDYDINKISQNVEGLNYFGPFESPGDLMEIYGRIDIIVLFYPEQTTEIDWFTAKRICRSNRFYEACYFKKPILAFSFSEDGKKVIEYDIGLTFDNYKISEIVESISKNLTREHISKWKQMLGALPDDVYTIQHEPCVLKEKLIQIITS